MMRVIFHIVAVCLLASGVSKSTCAAQGVVTNSNDVTFSVTNPKDGSLWVATRSRGVLRQGATGRVFSYSCSQGDFPCDSILTLAVDSTGVLWMRDAHDAVYNYSSISGFVLQESVPAELAAVLFPVEPATESPVVEKEERRSTFGWAWLPIVLCLLFVSLLYYLRRPVSAPAPAKLPVREKPALQQGSEFAVKVTGLVQANYIDPAFDVERIAEALGITRVHLCRKLKSEGAASPSEILKDCRMKAAADLLKAGETNISEVASRCGFSSATYFSSAFKAYFSITPSEYVSKTKV